MVVETNVDVSSAEIIELKLDKTGLSASQVNKNNAPVELVKIDDDIIREPPFLKLTNISTESIRNFTNDNNISNSDFLTRQLSEIAVNRNSGSNSAFTRNEASSKGDQKPKSVVTRSRSSSKRRIDGQSNKVSSEDSKKEQQVESEVQSEVAGLHAVDANDNGDSVEENLQNGQTVSFVFNSYFCGKLDVILHVW